MAKRKSKKKIRWDKWDYILIALIAFGTLFEVFYYRMRANLVYGRSLFDITSVTNGEFFVWENAPPMMQVQLGMLSLAHHFAFAILIAAVSILVLRIYKRAGWKDGKK